MKMLARKGYLAEVEDITFLADIDADKPLASLQAASCTYRIAFGPHGGQKVLSLRTVASRDGKNTAVLCADAHGFIALIDAGVPADKIQTGAFGDPQLRRNSRVAVLVSN
jgi:hypothetical protein